jgi:hypothetical protein
MDEANEALRQLAPLLELPDSSRAIYLASVCGAMVERGCEPAILAGTLLPLIEALLRPSVALVRACGSQLPDTQDDDKEDPWDRFAKVLERVAPTMQSEYKAWQSLQGFWPAAIAVFSLSDKACASAQHLRPLAAEIAEYHEAGNWFSAILGVLHREPILVIEPKTMLGITGTISGIVDNFQLNMLLMDQFPASGFFKSRRISRQAADVARGIGPQQSEEAITGAWNLYTWQAIEPGLKLPDPKDMLTTTHWVWNEGNPGDISVLDGHRVVLLGPPSYERGWRAQRTFAHLPATLEIDSQLTKTEVREWLERMLAAKGNS